MSSSKMAMLAPMWVLMVLWLTLVAVSGVLAYQKWQKTTGAIRAQLLYLWVGATIVFVGDLLHTIAFTVSTYTDNPTVPVTILGSIFEFRTFAMFFDALVFMVYYALWALFIVSRYQHGKRASYDKVSLGLAVTAMVLILPGVVPNALGVYTLEYNIAIWAPHIILFIVFGVMFQACLQTSIRPGNTNTGKGVVNYRNRICFLILVFHPLLDVNHTKQRTRNIHDS